MRKSLPPRIQMLLRVWAGKLQGNLLDAGEVASVATLLRKLANGETVEDVFGIWRPANRPLDPALEQRLHEMAVMRLPVELGGEGMSYAATIAEVAGRYGKSVETIKADYKSYRGKQVRAEVEAHGEFTASLGFAGKWQGGKTPE
jgi:hypothetical protein